MQTMLRFKTTLSLALISLISATMAFGQDTSSQVRYRLIDLGEDGVGNDITNSGLVAGSHNPGGTDRHATFWSRRQRQGIDLGTLPGDLGSRGFGINGQGQVVGSDYPSDFSYSKPMFWASQQSAAIVLPGLPDGFNPAVDINSAGEIVGQALPADESSLLPVYWANSTTDAVYLPPVSDELPFGVAYAINDNGSIVGDACDPDFIECHVAYWANSTSTPVTLASPGGDFIYTDIGFSSGYVVDHAINNNGSMVGFAYNADYSELRAVYWASSTSSPITLSTNDDYPNAIAESINDRAQIVGTAYNSDFSASHAFIWPTPNSPGVDLTTVIQSGTGYEVVVARSINNRGEIAGGAFLNGNELGHAVVLTPMHGGSANNDQSND
jgi:uncharacterized membrane protein